jgi:hypothetical protein
LGDSADHVAGRIRHTRVHVSHVLDDRRNTYSPGLVSSLLYVLIFYLLIRFGVGGRFVDAADFVVGTIAGVATIGIFLTVGPTILFPRLAQSRDVRVNRAS